MSRTITIACVTACAPVAIWLVDDGSVIQGASAADEMALCDFHGGFCRMTLMDSFLSHPLGAILVFTIVVGVVSTLILDLYALVLEKAVGIPQSNWGAVGHWLLGMTRGQFFFSPTSSGVYTPGEHGLGWLFHYVVGCAYAAMLPVFWGTGYIAAPGWMPVILIGFVLTTIAGLTLMVPGMGGGFLGLKTPNPLKLYGLVLLAHAVFTIGQYVTASAFAACF